MDNDDLAALGAHLALRRDRILHAWRSSVMRDRRLTTGDSLPRAQLDDHIPDLLRSFERRLAPAGAAPQPVAAEADQAAAHGLHRWQQGYDLLEVSRELGRLNECVVAELDASAKAHPEFAHDAVAAARRIWSEVLSISLGESTAQYFKLRQIEALGHMQDLEQALLHLRELERGRAELWQQIAHDLRGNLGVVANATLGLTSPAIAEPKREGFLRMLERNVGSLRQLLDDVTDLARLQAGREHRQAAQFDAASLLGGMCEDLREQAEQRGLFLRAEGPEPFVVHGDAVKVRRLAQNLILNAVKYTQRGGVCVSWGDSDTPDDAKRWMLTVQDTGPGLDTGAGAPLAAAIEAATELAHQADGGEPGVEAAAQEAQLPAAGANPAQAAHPSRTEQGEGIGLTIVKRLAELLDAGIEVETGAGSGTVFRVYLPRRYED